MSNAKRTILTETKATCRYCGREFKVYANGRMPNHAAPQWARELPGGHPRWNCASWGQSALWVAPVLATA